MAAYMEQVAPSHEEQEPLFTTTANLGEKSCGDWRVTTGTGGGYRWECLVTSQHVGGLGVMVAHCRLGATTVFVSYLGDKAALLFRDSAAFSTCRGGYKRYPKTLAPFHLTSKPRLVGYPVCGRVKNMNTIASSARTLQLAWYII